MDADTEVVDDYGIGQREGLQEAVEAVTAILGMQPCEGSEAVPPNARSHTALLAGMACGFQQVLVRISFGIDAASNVAMKLVARAETRELSQAVHAIIEQA